MRDKGHMMIPIVFLLYMLFYSGRTVINAVLFYHHRHHSGSQLKQSTRMSVRDLFETLLSEGGPVLPCRWPSPAPAWALSSV
jgi:alkyl hydroperoxide reductase subunit AhpF